MRMYRKPKSRLLCFHPFFQLSFWKHFTRMTQYLPSRDVLHETHHVLSDGVTAALMLFVLVMEGLDSAENPKCWGTDTSNYRPFEQHRAARGDSARERGGKATISLCAHVASPLCRAGDIPGTPPDAPTHTPTPRRPPNVLSNIIYLLLSHRAQISASQS